MYTVGYSLELVSDFPEIGNNLVHYKIDGTVYQTGSSLHHYLGTKIEQQVTVQVFSNRQT